MCSKTSLYLGPIGLDQPDSTDGPTREKKKIRAEGGPPNSIGKFQRNFFGSNFFFFFEMRE